MEVRSIRAGDGPAVVELGGTAADVDTSALLDVLTHAYEGGSGIVDAREVPTITSPLFGVLQAVAVRLRRDGARMVVVCAEGELRRLRAMRVGRDFGLSASLDGAIWELQRPVSRFQRQ